MTNVTLNTRLAYLSMSIIDAEIVRHYNRAPIVRATLDFLVEPMDAALSAELIGRLLDELGDAYPLTPEMPDKAHRRMHRHQRGKTYEQARINLTLSNHVMTDSLLLASRRTKLGSAFQTKRAEPGRSIRAFSAVLHFGDSMCAT